MLAVVGVPLHIASLTPGRCDVAPVALRKALERFSVYDIDHDRDLRAVLAFDFGDLAVATLRPEEAFAPIVEQLQPMLTVAQEAVVILGGDNSVTRPAFHALWRRSARVALLTLDAHLDLRSTSAGLTNGNPISALLADGLQGSSIIQVGLQPFANSSEYAQVARAAGIRYVAASEVYREGIETTIVDALKKLSLEADEIYVDVDLDVLERSAAPGCPGARPYGFTVRELRKALLLCGMHPKVRMVDFVEYDPTNDVSHITEYSAVIAILSFASGLMSRLRII
jgi:formiminoglutamase